MKINGSRYGRTLNMIASPALVVLLFTTFLGCMKIQPNPGESLQTSTKGYDRISQDTHKVIDKDKGVINAVAFSPNGKKLAVASSQGLWIYDTTATSHTYTTLTGHEGEVLALAWSDNEMLASGGEDRTVQLWNVKTSDLLLEPLKGHKGRVNTLAFSPDGKTLASSSGFKRDYISKSLDEPIEEPPDDPITLPTDPDAFKKYLLEQEKYMDSLWKQYQDEMRDFIGDPVNFDGTIRLWNSGTGELQQTLKGRATTLAFLTNGKTDLVSASNGSDAKELWEISTGRHSSAPIIRIGENDETVYIGRRATYNGKFYEYGAHIYRACSAVVLAPYGTKLAQAQTRVEHVTGKGKTYDNVKVKITAGGDWPTYINVESLVTTMAFSSDGNCLATAGMETTIQLWNVKTKKPLQSLTVPAAGITALAFSKNGMFACGTRDGTIILWKPK